MKGEDRCIYCGRTDQLSRHAHVVPRCMGSFENQPTLKNQVCSSCDTEIGKCEGHLIKCGMEALLRIKVRVAGRSGKDSSSPFQRKHYGHGPAKLLVKFPYVGWMVRVELMEDGQNCQLLPQLVLVAQDGTCDQIVLLNPMSVGPDELKKKIARTKGQKWKKAWAVQLSNDEADHIFDLLKQLGLYGGEEVLDQIKPFKSTVCVSGVITYGKDYFRAIAKIAFHYFLLHSKVFDGSEPEFDALRRFVRYGEGDEGRFIVKVDGAIAYDPSGRDRPTYYGHVLRTDVSPDRIAIDVQLFFGHDYTPNLYRVNISDKRPAIFLPSEEFGHYYRYLEPEKRTQYDGVIENLTVAQTIIVARLQQHRRK